MNGELAEPCCIYCWYCNCVLSERTWSLDHVIPLSRGGTDHQGNLVAACKRCNSSKGNKTIPEWRLRNVLAQVNELRCEILPAPDFLDFYWRVGRRGWRRHVILYGAP